MSFERLEKGDIVISQPDHPLNRQINERINDEFTHASLYIGEGKIIESSVDDGEFFPASLEAIVHRFDRPAQAIRPGLPQDIRDQAARNAKKLSSSYNFSVRATVALYLRERKDNEYPPVDDGLSCVDFILQSYQEVHGYEKELGEPGSTMPIDLREPSQEITTWNK